MTVSSSGTHAIGNVCLTQIVPEHDIVLLGVLDKIALVMIDAGQTAQWRLFRRQGGSRDFLLLFFRIIAVGVFRVGVYLGWYSLLATYVSKSSVFLSWWIRLNDVFQGSKTLQISGEIEFSTFGARFFFNESFSDVWLNKKAQKPCESQKKLSLAPLELVFLVFF